MSRKYLCLRTMCVMLTVSILLPLTGCVTFNRAKKDAQQKAIVIAELTRELERLNSQLSQTLEDKERLAKAKLKLEQDLKEQMQKGDISVAWKRGGLVVTVLSEVLFDPGKNIIKPEFKESLDKIVGVLKEDVPDKEIIVEGHTDSDPIKYSGWKTNWELSTARATSVVHYFINEGKINPQRLSAVGYGEFRPVASNETKEGKAQNRRVEIIILPGTFVKEKAKVEVETK